MARRATLAAVMLGVALLAAASACSAPDHTYVANKANQTFFKVPASWHEIDQQAIEPAPTASPSPGAAEAWVVAFDAANPPAVSHLVANHTPDPIVYVSVRPVPTDAGTQISLDDLRNLFLPVTATARAASSGSATKLTEFKLVSDSVRSADSGLHGIHEVFQYRVGGGPLQTFDETAYLNKEGSKVYLMILRCSAECYQARHAELDSVTTSFTIRVRP